ncbi:MAG: hypothetical protein K9G46_11385 [Flavobacteriales bacterium]|nr:hypothetical protein [Flavobacteriales bacterium]
MSELKDQLNKLNERVDELETNPSELTKDALLAEVRAFYDAVKNTELTAVAKAPKEAPAAKQVVAPDPVMQPKAYQHEKTPEPVVETLVEPVVEKVPEPIAEVPAPVVEEPKKVVAEPVAEAKPVEEPIVMEEKPKAKKEPMIGKAEPVSKAADKKILAGQFNQEPLADLRSGIPLNEKFGIIRNLFKGNASDFGDAVLKLNNAANAKEMKHYIELLTLRFEWDNRTEAYQNFMGYVERKMLTLQSSNADAD